MESWTIGMICNGIIAVAYLLICLAIVVPLARSKQLRSNPLGAATASIFFSCAVLHGIHAIHMALPSLGIDDEQGLAMRAAWDWPLSLWDVVGAVVAIYYWSLRRSYSSLMEGAQLFQDLRQREQQALELNDTVLQGLVVAKMALDLDEPQRAHESLTASIDSASRIITELLGSSYHTLDLVRSSAATVTAATPSSAVSTAVTDLPVDTAPPAGGEHPVSPTASGDLPPAKDTERP